VRLAAAEIQLVALCLLAAGQSAASAAPAAADPAGCSTVLAGAAVWPGTVSDRSGTRRIFSDAYYSFLDRRPACAPAEP
jgi:tagatose-1,6-bisphosphate aldolase